MWNQVLYSRLRGLVGCWHRCYWPCTCQLWTFMDRFTSVETTWNEVNACWTGVLTGAIFGILSWCFSEPNYSRLHAYRATTPMCNSNISWRKRIPTKKSCRTFFLLEDTYSHQIRTCRILAYTYTAYTYVQHFCVSVYMCICIFSIFLFRSCMEFLWVKDWATSLVASAASSGGAISL